jgi:hypothetical protein
MSSSTPESSQPSPGEGPATANKDERMWASFCHLAAFAGLAVPLFGNFLGPLVVWLMKKDEFPLVDDQGKEALNFQINILIYSAISFLLIWACVGIPLLIVVGIYAIVMTILATFQANQGVRYRYPMTIRFIH